MMQAIFRTARGGWRGAFGARELREVAAPRPRFLKRIEWEASWSGANGVIGASRRTRRSLRVNLIAISCWSGRGRSRDRVYPRFESFYPASNPICLKSERSSVAYAGHGAGASRSARGPSNFTVVVNHSGMFAPDLRQQEIVAGLQKGQKVATLEKRGSWTHIE